MIIDPDDRQVVGNRQSALHRHPPSTHRHLIRDRKDCSRRFAHIEESVRRLLRADHREITRFEKVWIDDDAAPGEALDVALATTPRHLGLHRVVAHSLNQPDPAMPEIEEMIDRQPGSRDVVWPHR